MADQVKFECERHFAPVDFVECIDQSDGCGAKLLLTIVSDSFSNVKLLQRHRQVQKTLQEAGFGMDQVHAITIRAWTVEEYKKKRAQS